MARASSGRLSHLSSLAVLVLATMLPFAARAVPASSVAIVGSLQSELGCPGDWQPDCAATELVYDANDDVWQASFTIPAGNWEYKAALNDSWDANYGANASFSGPNISLTLGAETTVKFYYDDKSHWVTDNVNSRIVTAPGSFQSELGCPGDWQPDCLRSWLQDPDGDGTFTFVTGLLPAGNYETKATIGEQWDENYGSSGTPGGANIPFTVPFTGAQVEFSFVSSTNVLTVLVESPPTPAPAPATLLLFGIGLAGLAAARRRGLH